MANRTREQDDDARRRRQTQSSAEEAIGGAAALVLGGLAAYGAYKWFTGDTDSEKKERTPSTQHRTYQTVPSPPTPRRVLEQVVVDRPIIIAVDATKERAGGFLHLPKAEQIFFYSIDWSHIFYFPDEPDKFEMVNALLALEIFEDYVKAYRKQYGYNDYLVVMTDNTFCTSLDPARTYAGLTNGEYRQLFVSINEKLTTAPFNGCWNYIADSSSNVYMKIADKLSRVDYSSSQGLPQLPNGLDPFPSFSEENISKSDYAVLHTVARQLPTELQQRKEARTTLRETFPVEEARTTVQETFPVEEVRELLSSFQQLFR